MEYRYEANICLLGKDSKLDCSQGKAGCSHIDRGYPPGTLVLPASSHEYVGSYKKSS